MEVIGATVEAGEMEAEYLSLQPLNKGVTLRLCAPLILESSSGAGGAEGNMFVCSNLNALTVVGTNDGFNVHSLEQLRTAIATTAPHSTPTVEPLRTVPFPSRIDFIRLADNENKLVVATRDGSLVLWDLPTLSNQASSPLHVFPPSSARIIDLLPCPSGPSALLITATHTNVLSLATYEVSMEFSPTMHVTSGCWSVKGKQIALGSRGGAVGLYAPSGDLKGDFECPPELVGRGYEVRSINWLENTVFLTTYAVSTAPGSAPNHDYEVYVVSKSGQSYEFTKFSDPTPAFGLMERSGRRWAATLKDWAPLKHLIFTTNAPSGEIGVIGQLAPSNSSAITWTTLELPESSRPSIPLTEAESADTCCLGLEFDLSYKSSAALSSSDPDGTGNWGIGAEASSKDGPRLMLFTSDGVLAIWRIVNDLGGPYPGRHNESGAPVVEMRSQIPLPPVTSATPSAFSAFGAPSASPFAVSSSQPNAFSSFGAPSSSPFAVLATATPAPGAFGAPSGFGATAFGAPSVSAFGASAFGATPASSTGRFAGFGASVPSSSASSPSTGGFGAFGATTAAPATTGFGAFGASTAAPTAGFGAFGASTASTGAFGAFGGAAKANAFGSGGSFAAAPAFGSSNAFGSVAAPTGSIRSTFGGSAATTDTFGSSTPVTFGSTGAATPTPAFPGFGKPAAPFGSTPSTNSTGFGAFSANTAGRREVDSDDDDDKAGSGDERVRGDDPPDLEPETISDSAGLFSTPSASGFPNSTPGSAFNLGSLGKGFSTPPSTSAFAPASTASVFATSLPVVPVAGPAASIASATVVAQSVSFGFGASVLPSATTSTGFAFGNRPSIYASAPVAVATIAVAAAAVTTITAAPAPIISTSAFIPSPPTLTPISTPSALSPVTTIDEPRIEEIDDSQDLFTPAKVASTPKSLFGFASSPPANTSPSLFSRFGIAPVTPGVGDAEGEGEEGEQEEGDYSSEGEDDYDGEDGARQQGSQEEDSYDEAERTYNDDEASGDDSRADDDTEEVSAGDNSVSRVEKGNNPLLARLDSLGGAAQTITPSIISPSVVPAGFSFKPVAAAPPTTSAFGNASAFAPSSSASPFAALAKSPFASATSSPFAAPVASSFSFGTSSAPAATPAPSPTISIAPVTAPSTSATSVAPVKPSLGGFGAAPKSNFFGFTSAAPKASSPLSVVPPPVPATSAFSFATPAATPAKSSFDFAPASIPLPPSAPPSAPASAVGSPAIVTATSRSPLSLALPPAPITAPSSAPGTPLATPIMSPFFLPSAVAKAPGAFAGPAAAALAPPSKKSISLGTSTTPKLGTNLGNVQAVKVVESGMTGEFLKAYQVLEQEFALLRKNTVLCKDFVREIGQPCQLPGVKADYDQCHWSLGDLKRLTALAAESRPQIARLVETAQIQKRQVAELQSLMLKAETKREEAARFVRARSDPIFAKMVRVRQLGPEQVENQKQLRINVEAARTRVEQIEEHIALVKDKVMKSRLGCSGFKAPSLDAVNRTVRNISGAVLEKTNEIDELSLRLKSLRVHATLPFTPTKSARHRTVDVDDPFASSPFRSSSPGLKPSSTPSASVVATVQAALRAERTTATIKRALASREAIFNTSACSIASTSRVQISELPAVFAAGPIIGNRIPKPRRREPEPEPMPAPSTSLSVFSLSDRNTATPPPAPNAPWSFSSPPVVSTSPTIKAPAFISFNTPSSTTASSNVVSSGGSARNRTVNRGHAVAISLKTTNSYNSSFVASTANFDWSVPAVAASAPVPTSTRQNQSFFGLELPQVVKPGEDEHDDERDHGEEEEEYSEDGDEFKGESSWAEDSLDNIAEEDEEDD